MLDLDPQAIHDLVEESAALLKPHFECMDELERWMLSRSYGNGGEFDLPDDWPENVPFAYVAFLMPKMTHSAPRFAFSGGGSQRMREQCLGLQGALNIIARQQQMHRVLAPAGVDFLLGMTCLYVDCESQPAHKLSAAQRRKMKGRSRFVPRAGEKYKKPAGQVRTEDSATPFWPTVDHLPRGTWGYDMQARTAGRIRFFYHDIVEDYEDLLARAEEQPGQWDMEAIKQLGAVASSQNPYAAAASQLDGQRGRQVHYRMVYVPEGRITEEEFDPEVDDKPRKVTREPGEHEHGVWLTIGVARGTRPNYRSAAGDSGEHGERGENKALQLAKPFYRRGPRTSPYHILGPHVPAGMTTPFSPLTATKEQIRLWNELGAASARRMKRYTRQVLFDLKDTTTMDAILDAGDDDYIGIPGFETGRAMVVERGGMSQQDMAHLVHQQQLVYRNLGMSETLQGNASGNTATAEGIAAQQGMERSGDVVDAWEQGLSRIAADLAWHAAYNDDFWVILDEQGKMELMLQDLAPFIEAGVVDSQTADRLIRYAAEQEIHVWHGGDFAEDPSLDFGLLRVEIEPYSMKRKDENAQKLEVLQLIPLLGQIGQMVIAQPHMEWREVLRDLGRVFGKPGLEKMLRMDIAQQLSQVMLAQGLRDTTMGAVAPSSAQRRGGPGGASGGVGGNFSPRPQSTRPAGAAKPPGGAGAVSPAAVA